MWHLIKLKLHALILCNSMWFINEAIEDACPAGKSQVGCTLV